MPAIYIEMCGLHDMMKLDGFSFVALTSLSLSENHDGHTQNNPQTLYLTIFSVNESQHRRKVNPTR